VDLRRLSCGFVAIMLGGVIGQSSVAGEDPAEGRRQLEARWRDLDFGKSLIKDRATDDFVNAPFEELPRDVMGQMYNHLAFSIQWDAHPQRRGWPYQGGVAVFHDKGGDFDVRVFAAYNKSQHDLIEYTWKRFGQNLRIVAGLNAMHLDINLDEVLQNRELDEYGENLAARTKSIVSRVIRFSRTGTRRKNFEISLPWPEKLEDGVSFCSNADESIMQLGAWHERVDAYVHNGVLSVLIYKKVPSLVGYLDGSKWFDDDFRALIHEKAREQGKVPPKGPASEE